MNMAVVTLFKNKTAYFLRFLSQKNLSLLHIVATKYPLSMKNSFLKAYRYLYKVSWFKFVLIMLAALAAMNLLCMIPVIFLKVENPFDFENMASSSLIWNIYVCFVGPLIETACVQYLLYKIFAFFITKKNRLFPAYVFGSSIVFGLLHLWGVNASIGWYIIRFCTAIAGGLVFSTTMYFMTRRKQHPFWSTVTVHAFWNTACGYLSSILFILLK